MAEHRDDELGDLLGEIRHELGNYLHKLYYCADAIQEVGAPDVLERSPGAILGETLRSFEGFLRSAFAHFSPVQARLMPMAISEVAAALSLRLKAPPTPHQVGTVMADTPATVRVDPGLLSQVAEILAHRIAARRGESGASLHVQTHDAVDTVTFSVSTNAPPVLAPRGIESVLDWAKARQLVALHGGALHEVEDAAGYRIAMSLRR